MPAESYLFAFVASHKIKYIRFLASIIDDDPDVFIFLCGITSTADTEAYVGTAAPPPPPLNKLPKTSAKPGFKTC